MKALSIRNPWIWWILHGGKNIENRSRQTKYRGFILLHASRWWDIDKAFADDKDAMNMAIKAKNFKAAFEVSQFVQEILGTGVHRPDVLLPMAGHIVGVAEIVDCVGLNKESEGKVVGPWFVGPYGYKLDNVTVLKKPYPYPGRLQLFQAPASSEVVRFFCRRVIDKLMTEEQASKDLDMDIESLRVNIRTHKRELAA